MENNSQSRVVTDAGHKGQHKSEELPENDESSGPSSISDLPQAKTTTADKVTTPQTTQIKKAKTPQGKAFDVKHNLS